MSADREFEIPQWIIDEYGLSRAREIMKLYLDRWHLISNNSPPGPVFETQVEVIREVLFGSATEIWWFAGNRGAKTEGGAIATASLATGIVPWCVGGTGLEDFSNGSRPVEIWVSSLDFPASRDIIRPKFERYFPSQTLDGPFRVQDQMYRFLNGSIIGMKSADSGYSKYQGVSRHLIWNDEEHPKDIYDEEIARVLDTGGKILNTMTPLNGMSWSYDHAWEAAEMKEDSKGRWKQTNFRQNLRVFNSFTQDNPFLPKTAIKVAASKWKDPKVRRARMMGLHTLLKGSHVFDGWQVQALVKDAWKQPRYSEPSIGLSVYEEHQRGNSYVIGADISKGKENGDFSFAVVLNLTTMQVVATMRDRVGAIKFAERLSELGKQYAGASLAIERNDHGIAVIAWMLEHGYPSLWRPRSIGKLSASPLNQYGFQTDGPGKSLIVTSIQDALEEGELRIPDRVLCQELSTFIYYDDKLPSEREKHKVIAKCGAMSGRYDDGVIALGLALIAGKGLSKRKSDRARAEEIPMVQRTAFVNSRKQRRKKSALVVERHLFMEQPRRIRILGGGKR